MVTDKIGAILVGAMIATLFVLLQVKYLVLLALLILIISTFLLIRFKKHESINITEAQKEEASASPKNFGWFFSHHIASIITYALVVTVAIMAGNTINNVYLYDVLKLTPDLISYTSIAYTAEPQGRLLSISPMNSCKATNRQGKCLPMNLPQTLAKNTKLPLM